MIEVEMCYKNCIDCTPVEFIDEWERCDALVGWMDTYVAHNCLASVSEHTAGSPDLLASPKESDPRCIPLHL